MIIINLNINVNKMRKIRNLMLMAGIISAVAIVVFIQRGKQEQMLKNDLLSLNVESLTSSEAPGTGGGVFLGIRVCSRKTGTKLCTHDKPNRKWAINVGTTFGYADIPDNDYEEIHGAYGYENYWPDEE